MEEARCNVEVRMNAYKIALGISAVLIVALASTSCGGGSGSHLMSITVSPATAMAASPMGTVQFTAMGMFSNQMTRALTASDGLTWTSSNSTMAMINGSGMAQCMTPGGLVTITASVPASGGSMAMIQGKATLT